MGWVRISDDFYDHPKFADITPLSWALWLTGLAYANRNLSDGIIPASVANRLCDFDGIAYETGGNELFGAMETDCGSLAIGHLLDAGLWHQDGHDCPDCPQPGARRYVVHDYLTYQPSKEKVEGDRAAAKDRMSRHRGKSTQFKDSSAEVRANNRGSSAEVQPLPTPNPSTTKDMSADADRFEEFWSIYPSRAPHTNSKKKAQERWKSAIKKADPDVIITAAKRYAEIVAGKDPQLTAMAQTWLYQERWNDDTTPAPANGKIRTADGRLHHPDDRPDAWSPKPPPEDWTEGLRAWNLKEVIAYHASIGWDRDNKCWIPA